MSDIKDNLIIYVSSKNNYEMLEHEVLNNINTEGFEFINVDDNSTLEQKERGINICKNNNILFVENKGVGVQMATQTVIDYINENRPFCKWVICFQHDNWPVSKDFFERISNLIRKGKMDQFGACGFNILDSGDFTQENSLERFNKGDRVLGYLGLAHLCVKDNWNRNICSKRWHLNLDPWYNPFAIEVPVWAIIGINVNLWNNFIKPTEYYQFHLWYPDIAMQYLKNNIQQIILPDLYCYNDQKIKEKYGMNWNSAVGAQNGQENYFGTYGPHLKNFNHRWGWDYENIDTQKGNYKNVYRGTLIEKYREHKINNGPYMIYNLGQY